MAYNVNFSDFANKGRVVVEDNTVNEETSLGFPGRNTTSYGTTIAENFLHLLENFANSTEPSNPVEGQLWYDTTPGVDQLKIFDGTQWISASGLKKGTGQPAVENSVVGDLWADTENAQLYLFSGSGWILVGPSFTDGLITGVTPETIVGTDNQEYTVLNIDVRSARIAIISNNEFVPKTRVAGFPIIKPGINLSSLSAENFKFYGTAEKAENLIVPGESAPVPAGNFLRSDKESTSNTPLRVKNNTGISIGTGNQVQIGVNGDAGVISHRAAGSNIDIKVNDNGNTRTAIRVDSSTNVGINNESPDETLDVNGNIKTSAKILVQSTEQTTSLSTGSAILQGGLAVAKNARIGGDTTVQGILTTQNITPDGDATRNIGDAQTRFLNVFSSNFIGNLQGNVTGQVSGRAGSADKLSSSSVFRFEGDISAPEIEFDGQTGGSIKTFTTEISNSFISTKDSVIDSQDSDEILINRVSGAPGLYKISKRNLVKDIPTIPVGTIVPFGGEIAPPGWLICDGEEVQKSIFGALFDVIGFNFRDPSLISDQGVNLFAIPDMRGRFPLGIDNMGGTSANRVTSNGAAAIGNNLGSETKQIEIDNLPEHEHDLRGDSGDQYYVIRDIQGAPQDPEAIQYDAPTGSQAGQAYPASGGVKTTAELGQPLDVMNPYLALNYIIYHGVA